MITFCRSLNRDWKEFMKDKDYVMNTMNQCAFPVKSTSHAHILSH